MNKNSLIIAGTSILTAIVFVSGVFFVNRLTTEPSGEVKTFVSDSKKIKTVETKPEKDLKIKGNKNSRIYHLPGCPNYNDIAERNIRWFKTHEEAKAAGFRMAKNC